MNHIPDPTSEISPDLTLFARTIDVQLPVASELYHSTLTLLMLEDNKAEWIARHVIDQREHLSFKTIAGDQYTLIKPNLSVEQLLSFAYVMGQLLFPRQVRCVNARPQQVL